jgi:hypothetical protein
MEFRSYDAERDKAAVRRIWQEVGWIDAGDEKESEALDYFISCGRAIVADVDGGAECIATTAMGDLRYLDDDLPFSCVTAVTTSHVARKRGLAGKLTAEAVAADAAAGAAVSGLGMFEQGYYDRLGFGSGGYENVISFDPAHLTVSIKPAVPGRITVDDWEAVHANRLCRHRAHGACNLTASGFTRAQMMWSKSGFGLGYRTRGGKDFSHHVWLSAEGGGAGPYVVQWLVYRDARQFLELMALIKSLGDQVRLVKTLEPPGIQMQDLLRRPFQIRSLTSQSKFENVMRALAFWQMRILDLRACLKATKLRGDELRFNLALTDPIADLLPADAPWRGVAGDYVVTLGPASTAEAGADAALPTLNASAGAFTRMWLGVRPASGLAVTDELSGPPELIDELDKTLRLPDPKPDWDF